MKRLTLMFAFAVVLAIAFTNSAFGQNGQYPIVENPAVKAQADADKAQTEATAAKNLAEANKKRLDNMPAQGSGSDTLLRWLLAIAVLAVLGFFGFRWWSSRPKGEGGNSIVPKPTDEPPAPKPTDEPPAPKPTDEPPAPKPTDEPPAPKPTDEPPAPKPTDPDLSDKDKGDLKRALSAIALFAIVASGVASAAPCSVSNANVTNSNEPVAITGIDNTVKCNTASPFAIYDPAGAAVARGTRSVTFKPAASGHYLIKVGRVTISPLEVMDVYLAGGVSAMGNIVRSQMSSVNDATARTQAQQANVRANAALTTANNAGQAVVSLDGQLKAIANRTDQLEQRISTLESRPATQVDLTPLERRVATLEAELARVKATANTALTTAQGADAKATDALTRYEEMGLARFKTGWFRSRTVVEAIEVSKAQAEKDAEEARVKAEKAAAKAAKKNQK